MFQSILDNSHSLSEIPALKWTSTEINASISTATILNLSSIQRSQNNLRDWGPKRDPLYIVIPITIIYTIIFFVGVIGNISTCIVIARNKCMHTATNYYLFSLAISDLLLLISGLPPEIYSVWSKYPYIFGEAFCVLQGFAAETSANATVLTITAFTVERYVAICHPFLSHTMSKLSRAIKFVMGIWFIAMFLAIPQAISFGIVYEEDSFQRRREDHYVCSVKRIIVPHAFEISTFVFFVFPMSVITALYVLIGLQLYRSTTVRPSIRSNSVKLKHRICKPTVAYSSSIPQAVLIVNGENDVERQEEEGRKNFSRNAQATKHVVKMLVAVVVAFFICWAPFHAQRLLAIYGDPRTSDMITAFRVLTYASGILYFLSTTINPLLYHIMSHRFREAFKDTFNRFFRRKRRPKGSTRCYTTLSGRSSQINSHSNTDSCSRQSSLRYLDSDISGRLKNSKRPLVVSFKRKRPTHSSKRTNSKQVFFDVDLQEALDNLKLPPTSNDNVYFRNSLFDDENQVQLEPKHVCCSSRIEDIEIFQEGQMKILKKKDGLNLVFNRSFNNEEGGSMTKSCTMPQIIYGENLCVSNRWNEFNGKCEVDRSGSCSQLEFVKENDRNSRNDGIIIQVP
ncbi:pyrokinin-1 receptor-like [Onthophagus taurus]|uniref:pyrokinin-1 receptor-like n=1 Tax=Onthophagus taurus TaxID=166361 RepID=UPI0039BE50C8